ncbi:2,3-bisphosphoglycerate-independent phosphoglycerate mutase [Coccomyxa sp. Obi]|nr:2,3-bisphosphoglycerate-independent phosphoglycerate mutase [Coccomyxa sp. Obi]
MPVDAQLKPHETIPQTDKPVLVCILDGWGENENKDKFNAIHSAETPVTDALKEVPGRWRTVRAHGTAVGLPSDADMGNSEVGHNALGSGQVIDQGARLVDIALEDGSAFKLDGWKYISESFSDNTVHFIGLLSDGGVHSRIDQLVGFMKGAAKDGAKRIRVHILTDGRDVPDGTSIKFVEQLEKDLAELGCDAKIASGGGRMHVTMDRYEADWKIVERGWQAHVLGEAPHKFTSALEAIKKLREGDGKAVTDQWLPPFVVTDEDGKAVGTIEDGDAVVLFNFRADRMVEISKAFEYEEFNAFDRKRFPKTRFVGMMQYDGDLKLPARFLVPPPAISGVSGELLANAGVSTFACSETQKFGHVTFFWNGNRSGYFKESLETYVEIPSDAVPFNEAPDMKAREITEAGKEALLSGKYQMVRINFANPDMVGHTGDLEACVGACSLVDKCVKELLDTVESLGGRWLLTADHGNADDMVQRAKKTNAPLFAEDGSPLPLTSHTLAPVPVAIGGPGLPEGTKFRDDLPNAGLANITATYLNLLGFATPSHMEPSLI